MVLPHSKNTQEVLYAALSHEAENKKSTMQIFDWVTIGRVYKIQCSPFVTLCLGSMGMDHVIKKSDLQDGHQIAFTNVPRRII